MNQFDNQTDITQATSRRRQAHSPWFWLFLSGGSIVLHLILIGLVKGSVYSAQLENTPEASLPIDFVELPALDADAPVSSPPVSSPESQPAGNGSSSTSPATQENEFWATETHASTGMGDIVATDSLPDPSDVPTQVHSTAHSTNFVAPARQSAESTAPNLAPAQLAMPERSEWHSPAAPSTSSANETAETPFPSPTAASTEPEYPDASQSLVQSEQSEQPEQPEISDERPLLPLPTPLITTQRIDVPVPDVTDMLPSVEAEGVDQRTETVTEQIIVPSELTASLTTVSPENNDLPLDEAAYPKQEVQTFAANSTSSPCVITPEAVPFLGKTVAMQVMTNELGQVVDTTTQESSQSIAYDALATCLVENWEFEPAIAQGQPIATEGLVVRITIEAEG